MNIKNIYLRDPAINPDFSSGSISNKETKDRKKESDAESNFLVLQDNASKFVHSGNVNVLKLYL